MKVQKDARKIQTVYFFLLEIVGKGQYQNNVAGLSNISSCLLFPYELVR